MKKFVAIALLGTLSSVNAETMTGKLDRILSRNTLMQEKQELVKKLDEIDQAIEEIQEEDMTMLQDALDPTSVPNAIIVLDNSVYVQGEVALKTGKDPESAAVKAEIGKLTEEGKIAVAVAKENEVQTQATLELEKESGDQPTIDAAQAVVDASSNLVKEFTDANTDVINDLVEENKAAQGDDVKVLEDAQAKLNVDVTKKVLKEDYAIVKLAEAELNYQEEKGNEEAIAKAKEVLAAAKASLTEATIATGDAAQAMLEEYKGASKNMQIGIAAGVLFLICVIYFCICKKTSDDNKSDQEGGDDLYLKLIDNELQP